MTDLLHDRCGRRVNYLRVSVTDRCNLRCRYCMPAEGVPLAPSADVLSFEEIVRAIEIGTRIGIDRVRITGGEPLLRRSLPELIRQIVALPGISEVAMTTNALLLHKHAEALADAGLSRLNVSLDSLRPDRFERLTRSRLLEETWRGIRAAQAAGLGPIKVNTVVVSGFNDDELGDWVELTRDSDLIVRFLEVMPMGEGAEMRRLGGFHDLTKARQALETKYGLEPAERGVGNGPARYWRVPGARGKLGFITPISDKYCDTCSRFRLTSTGRIRPCLASEFEVDALPAIRSGTDDEILEAFRVAALGKPKGHRWETGVTTATGMSSLGG
jgi:cyclic pyranopterin phosphate synthase